jgi:TP901 family phage tail tape measure protein
MAGKFVLTAQMQLQAPTNTRQVITQVRRQLSQANISINPTINTKALANANKQVQNVANSAKTASANLKTASRSASSLGSALGAAARRFASITIATGAFLALARGITEAFGRAVDFEKELLKISQVTGKTMGGMKSLTSEVGRLSTSLGVSSSELLNVARTLSQAGFSASKTQKALSILAKTDLGATFDNLADTTEGAIAILRQFRSEARATGGDLAFLEKSLDAINTVSKNFAVESADLISAVRRTGGVFESAGGKINELIALFTSVRATTRETAETIATGFRTIFTRIQRTETVEQLRELGIELRNAKGEFVGPLEAIKRLQIGLAGLSATDFRFQEVVEQLGGFRQVGKVIPLLKQFGTTQEALALANLSSGSTARDAATAQLGLGNAFAKLKEEFDKTVRNIADSDTFQTLARGAIRFAEAILNVVDALEPLLPIMTALAAFQLGKIAVPAIGRFSGLTGKNEGGKIYGFNRGGLVPGSGNRDTVPAMLSPGEFVIKKSSVQSIGAENLARANGYSNGGIMAAGTSQKKGAAAAKNVNIPPLTVNPKAGSIGGAVMHPIGTSTTYSHGGGFAGKGGNQIIPGNQLPANVQTALAQKYFGGDRKMLAGRQIPFNVGAGQYPIAAPQPAKLKGGQFASIVKGASMDAISGGVAKASRTIAGSGLLDLLPALNVNENKIAAARTSSALDDTAVTSMEGFIQEGVISAMTGAIPSRGKASFDLGFGEVMRNKKSLTALYGANLATAKVMEVKRDKGEAARPTGIPRKLGNYIAQSPAMAFSQGLFNVTGFNKGGQVDTVPAMLTPGEYVINKSSAQSIGYGNLNSMNKTGVQHFAGGGGVLNPHSQYVAPNPRGPQAGMGGMGGNIGNMGSATAAASQAAQKFAAQLNTTTPVLTQIKSGASMLGGATKKVGGAVLRTMGPLGLLDGAFNITGNAFNKLAGIGQQTGAKTQAAGNQIQTAGGKYAAFAPKGPAPTGGGGGVVATGGKATGGGGGGMAGLGNAAMMATFMAPMILESTNLSESMKKASSNALMLGGMFGMILVPLAAQLDAKIAETAASALAATADSGEAVASTAAMGPFALLAIAITIAITALTFFASAAKEAAKAAAESAAEESKRVIEGGGKFDRAGVTKDLGTFVDEAAAAEMYSLSNAAGVAFDTLTGFSSAVDAGKAIMAGDWKGAVVNTIATFSPFARGLKVAHEQQQKYNKMIAQKSAIESFVNASAETAETLGNYNAAIKKNEQMQLTGLKAVNANIRATNDFVAGQSRADKEMAKYEAAIKKLGDDNIFSGEEFDAAKEQLDNSREELAKANFEAAARVREGISTMVDSMRESGKSFDEIFADPRYKAQLTQLTQTLSKGFEKEILASGSARDEAMAGGGFGTRSFEDLSAAEKELVKTREKQIAKTQGAAQAEEAAENLDKANKEAAKAEEERIRELKALKAAELELVKLERARTQAINKANRGFELASVAMGQIDSAVKGFSGSIQDAKVNVGGLIKTLKDGFSPEAFAAARRISPEIAESIRSGLAKNKKLEGALDSLVEQFAGENLSNEQRKDALSDAGIDFGSLSDAMQEKLLKLFDDGFDSTDIKEAQEILGAEVGHQVELLQKLAKAQGDYVNVLSAIGDAVRKNKKEIIDAYKFEVDVRHKGIDRILKATGQEMTVRMARARTNEKAGAAAGIGGPVNVAGLAARGQAMNTRVNQIQQARNNAGPVVGTEAVKRDQNMANAQKLLQDEIGRTKDALKILADRSDEAAAVMGEIEKEKSSREAMQGAVKDFTFATNEQRQGMNQEFAALQRVLQTGNINAIPDKFRSAVGKLLDQFKDVPIFGKMTGGDVSKNLQIRQMEQQFRMMSGGKQGVPPQLVKAIFEATTKEEQLIADLRQLNKEEQDAAAALRKLEEQEANQQLQGLMAMKKAAEDLLQWLKTNTTEANDDADNAGGAARGGFVPVRGFAKGGNVFQPRGTDTVPAMLTPGEFVIRKSAVDKIGTGALSALNNGNASTVYRKDGGPVNPIERGFGDLIKGSFAAMGDTPNGKELEKAFRRKINANGNIRDAFNDLVDNGAAAADASVNTLFPSSFRMLDQLSNAFMQYGIGTFGLRRGVDTGKVNPKNGEKILRDFHGFKYGGNFRTFYMTPNGFMVNDLFNNNDHAVVHFKTANDHYLDENFAPEPFRSLEAAKDGGVARYLRQGFAASIADKKMPYKKVLDNANAAKKKAQSDLEGGLNARYNPQLFADIATLEAASANAGQVAGRFLGTTDFAIARLASGGSVDSVPAMLTPGEFVMSTAAVKKHGTGFMKQVNKGNIPGFAKGGSVNGVQYRKNGGGILGGRVALMEALDNVSQAMSAFNTVANALQDIATQFGNMQITHNVNVSGSLAIPGFTQEAINKLVNIIGDSVAGSTATKIDNAITMWQREQDGRVA